MEMPKYLRIFVPPEIVHNVTETGEVTATKEGSLDFIKLIAKGLGCSYMVFSEDLFDGYNGDLYIGGMPITFMSYYFTSYPYTYTDVRFAIEKPPYKVKTFATLQPFSLSVWIGLLLSVILVSLIHFLIFRRRIPFRSAFFYIVGTLFGDHHNWRPKSMAQKMLILTWSVGIMFFTFSYGLVLLSFLTVPVREKGITDFDDLYEAVRLKQAIAVSFEHSTVDSMMRKSKDTKFRFLGEHLELQNEINDYNALQIIQKNVAVITTRRVLTYAFAGDKYFISEDSILPSYLGIFDYEFGAFCCMKRVNDVIHRIWAAGIHTKLYDDLAFKHRLHDIFNYKDQIAVQDLIRPLSLADLSGAFYFLVTGHILGLICFVVEYTLTIVRNQFKKHKSSSNSLVVNKTC